MTRNGPEGISDQADGKPKSIFKLGHMQIHLRLYTSTGKLCTMCMNSN